MTFLSIVSSILAFIAFLITINMAWTAGGVWAVYHAERYADDIRDENTAELERILSLARYSMVDGRWPGKMQGRLAVLIALVGAALLIGAFH